MGKENCSSFGIIVTIGQCKMKELINRTYTWPLHARSLLCDWTLVAQVGDAVGPQLPE